MSTHAELKQEYKLASSGDSFGDCMGWLFPIAIELDVRGDIVPDSWRYRAGALGSHHEPDCYVAEVLQDYDSETLTKFGNVLSRYQSKLHAAGLTY